MVLLKFDIECKTLVIISNTYWIKHELALINKCFRYFFNKIRPLFLWKIKVLNKCNVGSYFKFKDFTIAFHKNPSWIFLLFNCFYSIINPLHILSINVF